MSGPDLFTSVFNDSGFVHMFNKSSNVDAFAVIGLGLWLSVFGPFGIISKR